MKSLEQRKREAVAYVDSLSQMNYRRAAAEELGGRIAKIFNKKYANKSEDSLKTINGVGK